jgi:D-serine deaminase-like pyridoxal phosphate-dependent protein
VAKQLGPGSISLLVDHPEQLKAVLTVGAESGMRPHVYIKIDMGTHRSGVAPQSPAASQLISHVLKADDAGQAILAGLYSHAGHAMTEPVPLTYYAKSSNHCS